MAGERSQNALNETECYFSRIPVEIVEKIISYLSPYGDFYNAKIVCRMWYGLISRICEQRVQNFNEAVKTGHLRIRTMSTKSRISPLPRFSHGSCIVGERMYIFGGCSSSNTAFNDLYCLNLRERRWIKPLTAGNPPPPRECATLVVHDNKDILIFGGWCQPARVGINSMAKFFDDLYIFSILTSSWKSPVVNEVERPRPCKRAGHGACVLGHKMVIFGGAQRELRLGFRDPSLTELVNWWKSTSRSSVRLHTTWHMLIYSPGRGRVLTDTLYWLMLASTFPTGGL